MRPDDCLGEDCDEVQARCRLEARIAELERVRAGACGRALVDAEDSGLWLYDRCDQCGHRLRFEASGCPQCSAQFGAPWKRAQIPDVCECERCREARELLKKDGA
jgi:hypothetical protein